MPGIMHTYGRKQEGSNFWDWMLRNIIIALNPWGFTNIGNSVATLSSLQK